VLGAGAGVRHRAKPVGPAEEVSCAGRALALAAAIRELVTTDPLIVELLLREGGDSPLLHWWHGGYN
jgi:hypothetical protein